MDIQYKPTKQKKEKPPKAPKAPKAEKAMKFSPTVQSVKARKPKKEKTPKIKTPKPEKVKAMEFGKPVKPEKAGKIAKERKSLNPKVAVAIVSAVIVISVAVLVFAIPASRENGTQIKSIKVTQLPEKTVYLQGETANYDGLRVTVTQKNGESFIVRAEQCKITGFDGNCPMDKQIVTVSYGGFMDTFTVKVLEHEKPAPVLKAIWLDPLPKTEYKVGEWLDTSGAVMVREYKNGDIVYVNLRNLDVYGWEKVNVPGKYILTVKYAENGVLCTFDYEITVTE